MKVNPQEEDCKYEEEDMPSADPDDKVAVNEVSGENAPSDASLMPRKIRVIVRVRTLLPRESGHGIGNVDCDVEEACIRVPRGGREKVKGDSDSTSTSADKIYRFDKVFDGLSSQSEIYNKSDISSMLDALVSGYNATIIAYGQTGSGKTYTMEGYKYETSLAQQASKPNGRSQSSSTAPKSIVSVSLDAREEDLGIAPRITKELFHKLNHLSAKAKRSIKIKCSFYQIYNEKVYDLLNDKGGAGNISGGSGSSSSGGSRDRDQQHGGSNNNIGLRIRWDVERGFYVENLFETECNEYSEVMLHYKNGVKNKVMSSHAMNDSSSRAHCIFTLAVESVDPAQPSDILRSKLTLVDLAGSEKQRQTKSSGDTLKESIHINKSLVVLRRVIKSLAGGSDKAPHAPFRDSKLTSLLKQSLEGNSVTLMIACLSPSDEYTEENLSTLNYASLAQAIAIKPRVNESIQAAMIRQLKAEVGLLRTQLKQAQEVNQVLSRSIESGTTSSVPNTSRGPLLNGGREESGGGMSERHVQSMNAKLKADLLENIALIKRMFNVEQSLRSRLEAEEVRATDKERENRLLYFENAELRERIEILESVVLQNSADASTATAEGLVAAGVDGNQIKHGELSTVMTNNFVQADCTKHLLETEQLPKLNLAHSNLPAGNRRRSNSLPDDNNSTASAASASSSPSVGMKVSHRGSKAKRRLIPSSNLSNITFVNGSRITSSSSTKSSRSRREEGERDSTSYLSVAELRELLSSGTRIKSTLQSKTNNLALPPTSYGTPPMTLGHKAKQYTASLLSTADSFLNFDKERRKSSPHVENNRVASDYIYSNWNGNDNAKK